MLRTRICDELGIEYPIFGAGMGGVTLSELVAAVSNAGGLGVMGATSLTPEQLREEIRRVRSLTSKPFGVDLLMPVGLPPNLSQVQVPSLPPFLEPLLDEIKDLPDAPPRVALTEEFTRRQFQVVIEEKVPVYASGLGTPKWVVDECHAHGIKVIALVGNVKNALRVEQLGVDYIVAQGAESGGHTGRIGTMVLVPAVVDAVKVPVIAAGGIGDGRAVAASLMLGAQGVWIGTRFLLTPEAVTPQNVKERMLASDEEGTAVTKAYTGKPTRVLRNRYTDLWQGNERYLQPTPVQGLMIAPLLTKARAAGNVNIANWPTGQVTGLVHELKSAADVMAELVGDAGRLLVNTPGVTVAANDDRPKDRPILA